MKAPDAITRRIEEMQHVIVNLAEKREAEMLKPIKQRNHRLLVFLDKELKLYEFGIQQLQWAGD